MMEHPAWLSDAILSLLWGHKLFCPLSLAAEDTGLSTDLLMSEWHILVVVFLNDSYTSFFCIYCYKWALRPFTHTLNFSCLLKNLILLCRLFPSVLHDGMLFVCNMYFDLFWFSLCWSSLLYMNSPDSKVIREGVRVREKKKTLANDIFCLSRQTLRVGHFRKMNKESKSKKCYRVRCDYFTKTTYST
jgi:hypothetical protein